MVKLLAILALGSFAACNGSGSTHTTDSTSVIKTDTVTTIGPDTTKRMTDSTKKVVDSVKK